MIRHPNEGSSLIDMLEEDGTREEATAIAIKRVIAWQLRQAMTEKGLTKTAMADTMSTTRRQLDRILNPDDGNVTLETLQRAAKAVGRSIRLELV
jgi:DNA-binding phage protein